MARRTSARPRAGVAGALVRRALLDGRARTVSFAYVFAVYAWIQAVGYRHTYPTAADRLAFAHAYAGNAAIRLFYGFPYRVATIGGYCAWRVGGTLAIAAGVFGVLAAVRALRAEEDAGRAEVVLAGALTRTAYVDAALVAVAGQCVVLLVAEAVGLVAGGLPVGPSAFLALEGAVVAALFAAAGALVCQFAPTRRGALALATGAVGVAWLARMVADTWHAGGWLRWTTPLGWAEAARPFAGPRWWPVALVAGAAVPLALAARRLGASRDVGTGLVASRDRARTRTALLGGPAAQALRQGAVGYAAWTLGFGVFAFVLGMVSSSISAVGISPSLRTTIGRLGLGSVFTPVGYLSFVFVVFIVGLSFFVAAQVNGAHQEEASQSLETLLAQPVTRWRWLGGRLGLAGAAAVVLALWAGMWSWLGATSQGVRVSLPRMLEAGANALPTAALFLGVCALAYALAPRLSTAINYTLTGVAFLWWTVGSLVRLPRWAVDATPYVHVGFVPTQGFRAEPAAIMVAVGLVAAGGALARLRHRDLLGS